MKKRNSFPFWNPSKPVSFMTADVNRGKDNVPPERAIEERAMYALLGIHVTCWQDNIRVSVPMHESWRYGNPEAQ